DSAWGGAPQRAARPTAPPAPAPVARFFASLVAALTPPVLVGERVGRVLQLGLAVAGGHQVLGGQPELLHEVALDGFRTPFREALVVLVSALAVSVAGHQEHAVLELRTRQRLAEFGDRGLGLAADLGRVVVKVDLEIDARLFLGDRSDPVTLA